MNEMYTIAFIIEIVILFFLSRSVYQKFFRLFQSISKSKKVSLYLTSILFLPGTFIHELAHTLAAILLFVPVSKFNLKPEYDEKSVKLGSVSIVKTDPVRSFIVSSAPLFFGLIIILSISYLLLVNRSINNYWEYLLAGYLIFQVGNSMFLSRNDLKGMWIFAVLVILIIVLFNYLDVRLSISDQSIVNALLKNASLYLLVPVSIDFMVLLLFRFITVSRKPR